jgi:hypothetical protein
MSSPQCLAWASILPGGDGRAGGDAGVSAGLGEKVIRGTRMAGTSTIEHALQRLASAVGLLEGAIDGRFEREHAAEGVEAELQRLGTDRSRLAQSLDAAEARSARLEEANREVSRRLVAAMESIREILARNGGA